MPIVAHDVYRALKQLKVDVQHNRLELKPLIFFSYVYQKMIYVNNDLNND